MRTGNILKVPLKRRRRFLKALTVAPLLPASLSGCSRVTKPSKAKEPSLSLVDAQVQALTEVIRHLYGSKLSDEQLSELKSKIEANLKTSQRLRQVKLKNNDEPDVLFSAIVPGNKR